MTPTAMFPGWLREGIRRGAAVAVLGPLALLQACDFLDRLVDVEAPSQIDARAFERPENANQLLDGAVGDFECAFSHYVTFIGTFTDELAQASGSESWRAIDARHLAEAGFNAPHAVATCDAFHQGQVPGVYKTLSTARYEADHLIELLDEWGDVVANAAEIRATAAAYSGYSHLLLGESMCSAAFDVGPELQPMEIFQRAEARFTAALDAAGGLDAIRNLALVGRARARLNMADAAGAAADAAQVPDGFRYDAEYSSIDSRRENLAYVRNVRNNVITVEATFRDFGDPRVPVLDLERSSPLNVPLWAQQKYTSASAPIRLASWVEAQLILAEVALGAGDLTGAVDAINRVRTRPGLELEPFQGGDAAAVKAQLVAERMAEFFLEGHRINDVRRLGLPLEPAPGTQHPLGGTYGDQTCLPLPLNERVNNPNIGA